MPPRIRYSREDILGAACKIAREQGIDALSARTLADRLGSSTRPMYRVFPNMDSLKEAVRERMGASAQKEGVAGASQARGAQESQADGADAPQMSRS